MTDYETIIISEEDGIGRIRFNKPPLNVMDIHMMREINSALEHFQGRTLKALVLDAEGKAFSAGVDISDHSGDKALEMIRVFHGIFDNLLKISAPTVAVAKGAALGGGCEGALFCDIVIASEKAKFGQPEIKVGVFPPVAAAIFPKILGEKKALELLLTGDVVRGAEAKDMGLVNQVFPVEGFDEAAENWIREKLGANSAAVLKFTKKAFMVGASKNYPEAIAEIEEIYLQELMKTYDANEGLTAFLEKRRPDWKDE